MQSNRVPGLRRELLLLFFFGRKVKVLKKDAFTFAKRKTLSQSASERMIGAEKFLSSKARCFILFLPVSESHKIFPSTGEQRFACADSSTGGHWQSTIRIVCVYFEDEEKKDLTLQPNTMEKRYVTSIQMPLYSLSNSVYLHCCRPTTNDQRRLRRTLRRKLIKRIAMDNRRLVCLPGFWLGS